MRKLNTEIDAILKLPDITKRLQDMGSRPIGASAEEFGALIRSDLAMFASLVKAAGIKPQ